eukprot:231109-Pyramimonas_sp.AAC.1
MPRGRFSEHDDDSEHDEDDVDEDEEDGGRRWSRALPLPTPSSSLRGGVLPPSSLFPWTWTGGAAT